MRLARTVGDFRRLSSSLHDPLGKLSLIIADQKTTNTLIDQFAAQAAAQNQGNVDSARGLAQTALAQLNADLATANLFQMDATVVQVRAQKLAIQLSSAATAPDLDKVTGGLQAQDQVLQQAMQTQLPDKAITISLQEQVLRAFEHGKSVFWTYVTTGRPGLETDPGHLPVYRKAT